MNKAINELKDKVDQLEHRNEKIVCEMDNLSNKMIDLKDVYENNVKAIQELKKAIAVLENQ